MLVGDTLKAAEVLTREWPRRAAKGQKYAEALDACRRVLIGEDEPEEARQAFIEAAREADILAE